MFRPLAIAVLLSGCTPEDDERIDFVIEPVCGISEDLLRAPQPLDTEVGRIAAIDLLQVQADVTVAEDGGLEVQAWSTFLVGEDEGLPVLELTPEPEIWLLDGVELSADQVLRTGISDPVRQVVVLDVDLERCSEHELEVRYPLPVGWMEDPNGQARLEHSDAGTWWSAGLEDDRSGRFLGMWMPSNLLFDRFDLELAIHVSGENVLATTGESTPTADGWQIVWPRPVQSHSPFWVLSPAATTHSLTLDVDLDVGPVTVEVYGDIPDDLAEAADRTSQALTTYSADFGPYLHGDRFVMWIRDDRSSSMEFDGATVTALSAIEHEVFHTWFGRGAAPVADIHGWVDEAIVSWGVDLMPYRAVPLDLESDPVLLAIGEDEWAGADLSVDTYVLGSYVFASIADRHGSDEVKEALGAFYVDWGGASYRSEDLEEHLTCWFDDDVVRHAFRLRAYGLDGAPPPRPIDWCR